MLILGDRAGHKAFKQQRVRPREGVGRSEEEGVGELERGRDSEERAREIAGPSNREQTAKRERRDRERVEVRDG